MSKLQSAGDTYGRGPSGTVVERAQVKYVGKRTFFLKKGFWTDSEYEPEMKVIEVAYGSDKYFDLLSKEPELGKYLALGTKVIVCHKGKCYKIEE